MKLEQFDEALDIINQIKNIKVHLDLLKNAGIKPVNISIGGIGNLALPHYVHSIVISYYDKLIAEMEDKFKLL